MLLHLIKKLFGNCQIPIFTLSEGLTIIELVWSILAAVFMSMIGGKVGHYHLGVPIGTWYEWLFIIINIVCLGLEFLGLQKKIFGIIVFSCVFRCIDLLGLLGLVILFCVFSYFKNIFLQSVESDSELSKSLECIESPFW